MKEGFCWQVACAAGLEGVVARELRALGIGGVRAENGVVAFEGGAAEVARALVWLRAGDRVQLEVARFPAATFEELFQGVKRLPWDSWMARDACFPVTARCVSSRLMSVPDCQAIAKKAVVERMKSRYHAQWFAEQGALYPIHIDVRRDVATVTLDACGDGLHKRGYRPLVGEAPLRETLAGAMVLLSGWNGQRRLVDPFCGSGTLPIEAAMWAAHVAPGERRSFTCARWNTLLPGGGEAIVREQNQARAGHRPPPGEPVIIGRDIDGAAIAMAREHVRRAGLEGWIRLEKADVRRTPLPTGCLVLTNPPYGERLGDKKQAEALYAALGRAAREAGEVSLRMICAHPQVGRLIGRRPDSQRKLYNGRLECRLYAFQFD
nr:class I SAM-dependent RNA methyltransferase [bacterium]